MNARHAPSAEVSRRAAPPDPRRTSASERGREPSGKRFADVLRGKTPDGSRRGSGAKAPTAGPVGPRGAQDASALGPVREADRDRRAAAAKGAVRDDETQREDRTRDATELPTFRPPGVLAPPGARGGSVAGPVAAPPPAAPEDVARIAEQLVQSMQVGGDRHRAGVRMRLTGRSGEPIDVQLVADADGVRATLAGGDDAATRSLAIAIEREMRSRNVSLSGLSVE